MDTTRLVGLSLLCLALGWGGPPDSQAAWRLVWADEFSGQGLPDPAKWGYEVGQVRNNERQYYTHARKENVQVAGGMLFIISRKEAFAGAAYTSASLVTKDTATWTYGRVVVRAKVPTGRGIWPAIWMLGANFDAVSWPACGEIDLMEHVGFDPQTIYGTVHTTAYNGTLGTQRGAHLTVPTLTTRWHVYTLEWWPDRLHLSVDGTRYFTFLKESNDPAVWPFNTPFYLILNTAVGGTWGGAQGIDESMFPQVFLVDYVRVYTWEP